jgi:PAS domain S-box-containing protein
MVGVTTDVTGIKESAIALQQMAKVFQESADAVLILDREGLIVEINPAAENQYGWSREELVGESIRTLVPRAEQAHRFALMTACLGGEQIHSVEGTLLTRDGRTLPILLTLSQLTDEVGTVVGLVSISKDISTMRNLQREVLEVADREQRRMGEDLHDSVQQDLAGFRMIARSLVDSLAAKGAAFIEANELVDFQTKLARFEEGLAQTSDTIAAMSRGLAGLQVESLGLPEALHNMVNDVRKTTDVDCRIDCSDSLRLDEPATATHLFRITQEAVTNALKHSDATQLWITLRVHDDALRVEIRDNGCGFDGKSDQGMGLSIMAHRASLLAGTFAVNRVESGGTLVTCDIPISHLA